MAALSSASHRARRPGTRGAAAWWMRLCPSLVSLVKREPQRPTFEQRLARLPAVARWCLVLREREALEVAAIAELVGASPRQVAEWLYEARERLASSGR